jgi:hypothetical protein
VQRNANLPGMLNPVKGTAIEGDFEATQRQIYKMMKALQDMASSGYIKNRP